MRIILFASLLFLLFGCSLTEKKSDRFKTLSVQTYQDKVYASWIGQIIGNTYGLSYEFKYIDNPGPDMFPYGYGWNLVELKKNNGAFSDDDTDIEYMYLNQMEKHGIEPSYYQLAEAWKNSVKTRVWCANRAAITLMHANHFPPVTGMAKYNVQWCQIDPQLVNEIWAITAPGMQNYAVEKSEFAARITSDSIGLEPTLHYAAMFSAAFFESDVNKLVDIGNSALKPSSHFAQIVNHVKELYKEYPNDWQKTRQIVKEKYYDKGKKNEYSWVVVDANLNGALGVMALLYGQGNFQKTLELCCALGMDCDNQAATMCGLLGVANGIESIPNDLLFPLKEMSWTKPFNNSYKMITREGLSDDSLTNTGKRISAQGERVILANGGKIIEVDGVKTLVSGY
ncbi:MAG: ADP-ribosylglycohydrolase family protein [Breznakibacter sp.]|nr:ADP-ribosylglycohydrolase family protein [Breznakibacter sp.]